VIGGHGFDSRMLTGKLYHRPAPVPLGGRKRALPALIFSSVAVLKACNRIRWRHLSRIRLNCQGDSRASAARCRCLLAVSGAPVQRGFAAMNFGILAGSIRPHGRVVALLAASALSATLMASGAQAQAPAPAAPPKAAPKAAPK